MVLTSDREKHDRWVEHFQHVLNREKSTEALDFNPLERRCT